MAVHQDDLTSHLAYLQHGRSPFYLSTILAVNLLTPAQVVACNIIDRTLYLAQGQDLTLVVVVLAHEMEPSLALFMVLLRDTQEVLDLAKVAFMKPVVLTALLWLLGCLPTLELRRQVTVI